MPKDEAGPVIGWSLGAMAVRHRIHDLVQFPCVYSFKVVGVAGFVAAVLERVAAVYGRRVRDDEHRIRESEKGNYQSMTLDLFVESGDQVYSIYAALHDDARVKYLL